MISNVQLVGTGLLALPSLLADGAVLDCTGQPNPRLAFHCFDVNNAEAQVIPKHES